MILEKMRVRLAEIDTALENSMRQLNVLQGHKNEICFHIDELLKEGAPIEKPVEAPVEVPVE